MTLKGKDISTLKIPIGMNDRSRDLVSIRRARAALRPDLSEKIANFVIITKMFGSKGTFEYLSHAVAAL